MNKKIKNNAICAYFGLWLLLMIPTKNDYINNDFVKKHSKTAILIHFIFLITYLIFISYWFLWKLHIWDFSINNIIAPIIFILLFLLLIYWAYKASLWEDFLVKDVTKLTKTENLVEIKNSNLNEQWVFTIILSLIPFIWFIIKWKFLNYKSPIIENNLKLNLFLTSIIFLVFLSWYENLWILLILFLSIFIAFYAAFIILNKNIINFNFEKIPTFEDWIYYFFGFIKYFLWYFWKNKFQTLKENIAYYKEKRKKILEKNNEKIWEKTPKLNEIFYFIPYLNILWLIDYNSKNHFLVKNWIIITLLSILFLFINNNLQVLVIILAFFGYGYSKHLNYQFPIFGDIYTFFENIFKKIFNFWKKIKENTSKVEEKSFKI